MTTSKRVGDTPSSNILPQPSLFHHLRTKVPDGAYGWFSSVDASAGEGRCGKLSYQDLPAPNWPGSELFTERSTRNVYLSVSAFSCRLRRKDRFIALISVMLDDVNPDTLPVKPTWVVETSPNNFQCWFILTVPISDIAEADAFYQAIRNAAGSDPGGTNVVRYGRSGNGSNTKKKHVKALGHPWECREERMGPEYSKEELSEAFELGPLDVAPARVSKGGNGKVEQVAEDDHDRAIHAAHDPLFRWMLEQKLLGTRRYNDSYHFDKCPGIHSSGNYGASDCWYNPRTGEIQDTFHATCEFHVENPLEERREALLEWAKDAGYEPPPPPAPPADDEEPEQEKRGSKEWIRKNYIFIAAQNAFYSLADRELMSAAALGRLHGKNAKGQITEVGPNGNYQIAVGSWLTTDGHGRMAAKLGWMPGAPRIFEQGGARICNTWQEPPRCVVREEPKLWIEHIQRVYGKQAAEHVFDFLAYSLQHPATKINHALVLVGGQGVGKGLTLMPFEKMDETWMGTTSMDQVMSNFQEWLWGHKLVVIDEAKRTKNFTADDVHNKLKNFIAAPPLRLKVNRKGISLVDIPNLISVVIQTNYGDSLHIDDDDRRYCILMPKVTDAELGLDYYTALGDSLKGDGCKNVIGWLQARNVASFNPYARPPDFGGLEASREMSVSADGVVVDASLDRGKVYLFPDICNSFDKTMSPHRVMVALKSAGWRPVPKKTGAKKWQRKTNGKVKTFSPWAHREMKEDQAFAQATRLVDGGLSPVPNADGFPEEEIGDPIGYQGGSMGDLKEKTVWDPNDLPEP